MLARMNLILVADLAHIGHIAQQPVQADLGERPRLFLITLLARSETLPPKP
jgi:hypothetical protein